MNLRHKYIAVEGAIGAGKTSLAQLLAERAKARLVLERLGVAPQEAVFIDDSRGHVEAAQALGLHGIHFTTPEELDRALGALLTGQDVAEL